MANAVLLLFNFRPRSSSFHRELKVFLRHYVTRFPGERIRILARFAEISAPYSFLGRRRENCLLAKKASCGLLGGFSAEIRERTN